MMRIRRRRRLVPPGIANAVTCGAFATLVSTSAGAVASELRPSPEPQHRIDLGVRTGFAALFGSYERGAYASDLAYGTVPFSLDASYHLSKRAALGVFTSYSFAIPKLCESSSDCRASLGHDVGLGLLFRGQVGRLWLIEPQYEIGTGYEWITRKLSSQGVLATRSYRGPLLARAAIIPTLLLGTRTRMGLVLGGSLGVSNRASLDAPGVSLRAHADAARLHGSLEVALRAAWRL